MNEFLPFVSDLARRAGALLLPIFKRRVRVEYKGDVDLVTEADRASEAFIVGELRSRYPEHAVLAEEGSGYGGGSGYRWYVDPVDGTTNFAHGFPVFAVSIALEKDGELLVGVVYDPTRDELFTAARGAGARLNGEPIHVSSVARLEEALVATGFPSKKRHTNPNIHYYHQMNMQTHGVRRPGSAALDLSYVAAGRFDAFWEFNLHPWDLAAGKLLVQEAGGMVTEVVGSPHKMQSPTILASNGRLHEAMVQALGEIASGANRAPLPPLSLPG